MPGLHNAKLKIEYQTSETVSQMKLWLKLWTKNQLSSTCINLYYHMIVYFFTWLQSHLNSKFEIKDFGPKLILNLSIYLDLKFNISLDIKLYIFFGHKLKHFFGHKLIHLFGPKNKHFFETNLLCPTRCSQITCPNKLH